MDDESDKIDALIASLEQSDKRAVRKAVDALISMTSSATEVADRLRALLDRAPAEKRWPIAYVLAQIASLSSPCLDALKDALDAADPDIRWAVALLLVRLGKKSDTAVARHLIELVHSGKPTQRRMAVYCLRDIGAQDTGVGRALIDALGDGDALVRVAVITSLKVMPQIGGAALDLLLRMFAEDADLRVRASAALALARLGAGRSDVRAALDNATRSNDPILSKAARSALKILEKR